MRVLYRIIFTCFFLLFPLICNADNDQNFSNIESFELTNGLKVVLKPTKNETNEILVSLTAAGGFADLPKNQRAAGEISAEAALRSGISVYGLDRMQTMLYDHSIEVYPNVQPFVRSIELSGVTEELDHLFQFIHLFFTKNRFSLKAYEPYKKMRIEQILRRPNDMNRTFNETVMNCNTNQYHVFQSLKADDIVNASFEASRDFFHRSFSNPSDFVFVLVGDFDRTQAKLLIQKYLANIPKKEEMTSPKIPSFPEFPNGVRKKILKRNSSNQTTARFTFPVQFSISEENAPYLEHITGLIRERLLDKFYESSFEKPEIIVSLEFPYYPSFHSAWISVQYATHSNKSAYLEQALLKELKVISEIGFSQNELNNYIKKNRESRRLSNMDNCYWLTTIVNYSLWGWDFKRLDNENGDFDQIVLDKLNKIAGQAISFDHYSIVSTQP